PTGDTHPSSKVFDSLVMKAIDQHFSLAHNFFRTATGFNYDMMREVSAWQMTMRMRDANGIKSANILVKAASQHYIDELHTTADTQHRQVFLEGPVCQGHFECI